MDEVIFRGVQRRTGNMELHLDRRLVDKRFVWPAVDVNRSGTRKEENLMHPDEAGPGYRRLHGLLITTCHFSPSPSGGGCLSAACRRQKSNLRSFCFEHEHRVNRLCGERRRQPADVEANGGRPYAARHFRRCICCRTNPTPPLLTRTAGKHPSSTPCALRFSSAWDERTYMPPQKAPPAAARQMALLARLTHEMTRRRPPSANSSRCRGQRPGLQNPLSGLPPSASARIRRASTGAGGACRERLVEEPAHVSTRAASRCWQEARKAEQISRRSGRGWRRSSRDHERTRRHAGRLRPGVPYDALLGEGTRPGAAWPRRSQEVFAGLAGRPRPARWSLADRVVGPPSRVKFWSEDIQVERRNEAFRPGGRSGVDQLRLRRRPGSWTACTAVLQRPSAPAAFCRITTPRNPRSFLQRVVHRHPARVRPRPLREQGLPAEHHSAPRVRLRLAGNPRMPNPAAGRIQVGRGWALPGALLPLRRGETFPESLRDVRAGRLLFRDQRRSAVVHSRGGGRGDVQTCTSSCTLELEPGLISGDLRASPACRRHRTRVPPVLHQPDAADAARCLQDIHWSFGGIGYFPDVHARQIYARHASQWRRRRDTGDPGRRLPPASSTSTRAWLSGRSTARAKAGERQLRCAKTVTG